MPATVLLESGKLPVEIINIASAKEKGPGRPPFWEMVFWWTRKPLASARAIILASLLPGDFDPLKFIRIVYPSYVGRGKFNKTPHFLNPDLRLLDKKMHEEIRNAKILDPFAGFGSIPIEAIRLGVGRVVACELLPSAVVFLRAVIEYPKWVADNKLEKDFVRDVEEAGKWITEELRRDPDINELYDDDTAVYIGTWEVKCPFCGKYTPLIGNWWLARVKNKKGYEALAWMKPVKARNGVEITVEQINDPRELSTAQTLTKGNKTIGIRAGGKEYIVGDIKLGGEPNINTRTREAICLNCYAKIKGSKDEWLIKEALREWNTNLERYLKGEITLKELLESKARPRTLVKVKQTEKTLLFQPTTNQDNEKLWKALEKLKQIWGDPDIPTEPIPEYEGRSIWVVGYGFDEWFKLFNPRQLLTLVKLVKLIREAGRRVKEEKLKQGWDKQKAHKYAEAITTYLAIALVRYATFSSIVSPVRADTIMGALAAGALTFRGIAMVWNWCELSPTAPITGSFLRNINTVNNGINYLINAFSGSSSRVEVVLDDATVLGKLGDEKFDLIVTDPPYRDDVAYSELSDFYYVWLKRALSDSNGVSLAPRFHCDVFFRDGVEVSTQWEWFSSREVSLSTGRCRYFGEAERDEECEARYREKLVSSFRTLAGRLSDGGVLVTYFAQSSPEAWIALIEAGLSSGLYPSMAFPVITESEESVVARGKSAITASIVISWRRVQSHAPIDLSQSYDSLVEEARRELEFVVNALSSASNGVVSELHGVTIYVMAYARTLSLLTRFGRPLRAGRPMEAVEIVRAASEILSRAYAKASGAELSSSDSIFYYLVKRVFPRGVDGRRLASSSDLLLLSYGIGLEYRQKALGELVRRNILKEYGREEETDVASRKTYVLIEPRRSNDELELGEVLKLHGVYPDNPSTMKSPVHVLHVLMLYSLKPRDVFMKYYEKIYSANPVLVAEAVELAKALSTLRDDPESELASRVLEYLGQSTYKQWKQGGLLDYIKR
ncbi:MAG: DUF1156 domain-containing protein [Desulfurococcaceae archaeon]